MYTYVRLVDEIKECKKIGIHYQMEYPKREDSLGVSNIFLSETHYVMYIKSKRSISGVECRNFEISKLTPTKIAAVSSLSLVPTLTRHCFCGKYFPINIQ